MRFLTALLLVALVATTLGPSQAQAVCTPEVYTLDGSCNNLAHPTWGMPHTVYLRLEPAAYADGLTEMRAGVNARTVSQVLGKDDAEFGNQYHLTTGAVFFGQLAAHDFAATTFQHAPEGGGTDHYVLVPFETSADPLASLSADTPAAMRVTRSVLFEDEAGVGQPINEVTHFLDLSVVYGSNVELLDKLREHKGGRLLMTSYTVNGQPFNLDSIELTEQLPNSALVGVAGESFLSQFVPPKEQLIAGDLRVIENPQLGALHTLFAREHNRVAARLAVENPGWTDNQIFERARQWTVAVYQKVLFYEHVAAIVGPVLFAGMRNYTGYDALVDPRMDVSFITSAARWGHTAMPDDTPIIDARTNERIGLLSVVGLFHGEYGPLTANLITRGQDNLLYSMHVFNAREPDEHMSDTMRSFPDPDDVFTRNLMRERLHGMPAFNDLRKARHPAGADADLYTHQGCGAAHEAADENDPIGCFMGITNNMARATKLRDVYGKLKNVDAFVGMVMEHRAPGSALGATQAAIFIDQFMRSRAGDRWWFENTANGLFTPAEVAQIHARSMSDLVADNMGVKRELLGNNYFLNRRTGVSV